MDPVFDEEEIELELGESIEIEDETPGPSRYIGVDDEDIIEDYDDVHEYLQPQEEGSEDSIDGELSAEQEEGRAYASSMEGNTDEEVDLDVGRAREILEETPHDLKHPVSLTGLGSKVPLKLKVALEILKEQIEIYKEKKSFEDVMKIADDPSKTEGALVTWNESPPETSEKLEEQLTAEFLAYAFIKYMLRRQYDDDADGDEKPYRPSTDEEWGFVSDFLCSVSKGETEIYKFFHRLKNHESFSQYLPYLESLSAGQVSALIWDSSVRAQRIILKLSNLHESALSTLDKVIKLNRETAVVTKTECEYLEARIKNQAANLIQNYGNNELTTSGRKNLLKALSAPYFKTANGVAAPEWNPLVLPNTYQQLMQSSFNPLEVEAFQVAVLKTIIETKIAQIDDRCSQLLNKAVNLSAKPVQCVLRTPCTAVPTNSDETIIHTEVKISCSPEVLIKWKDEMVTHASKLSLDDVVNDPYIRINWLNVSSKMSQHTSKACTVSDCKRLWETVVLPNLQHQKQKTSLQDIPKLMKLVSIWGERNWDIVATKMGSGYTAFQCFTAFEYFRPGELDAAAREQKKQDDNRVAVANFHKIVKLGSEFSPEINKEKFTYLACQVTELLVDAPNIPLQTMAEHYNRFFNPDMQKHSFKLVEDLLLIVCMVKMREHLILAKNFAPLRYYLPWRFVSNWACRADIMFSRKAAVWSREEDLQLLLFAHEKLKFDWKLFFPLLGSDKNRKNARGRYIALQERLKRDSFENIRQEYERKGRNQTMYTNFSKHLEPLEEVLRSPRLEVPSYAQLCHNPHDNILWTYLHSFDKNIVQESIRDLKQVIEFGEPFLKPQTEKLPVHKFKSIDRRKFTRGDPASTASAIHLRKVALKPKEEIDNLTMFQVRVYSYYQSFKAKVAKTRTERKYLPSVNELLKMGEIRAILSPPKSKINQETPTDGVPLDVQGFPILDNSAETVRKFLPHQRKKNLGWVKAQIVRREKRLKKLQEKDDAKTSPPVSTQDSSNRQNSCQNSLEEPSSNDISMDPVDDAVGKDTEPSK